MKRLSVLFGLALLTVVGCSVGNSQAKVSIGFNLAKALNVAAAPSPGPTSYSVLITCSSGESATVTSETFFMAGTQLIGCIGKLVSFTLNGSAFNYSSGFTNFAVGETGLYATAAGSVLYVRVAQQLPSPLQASNSIGYQVTTVSTGGSLDVDATASQGALVIGRTPDIRFTPRAIELKATPTLALRIPMECDTALTGTSISNAVCEALALAGLKINVQSYTGQAIDANTLLTGLANAPTFQQRVSAGTGQVIAVGSALPLGGFEINQAIPAPSTAGTVRYLVSVGNLTATGNSFLYWIINVNVKPPVPTVCSSPIVSSLLVDTSNSSFDISGFTGSLISRGWTVGTTSASTKADLDKYRVVVYAQPGAFSASKLTDVRNYVQGGGGLIILSDYSNTNGLNNLATTFGVTFNVDMLHDSLHNKGAIFWPIINDFASHPILSGITSFPYYAGVTLNTTSPATAIASGDADSVSNVSAANGKKVLAVSTLGMGKAVFFGDATIMHPSYYPSLLTAMDIQFLNQMVNWLACGQ